MRRLVLALAVGVFLALVSTTPAAAHAELESTDPAPGSVSPSSPPQVVLRFSEAVAAGDGAVEVFDDEGDRVDGGGLGRGADDEIALELPPLADGGYVVAWRIVSGDSHPIEGGFTFRVGSGSTASVESGLVTDLVGGEGGDTALGALYGVVRFLGYAGLALAVGGGFFLVALWPGGAHHRPTFRLVMASIAATAAATVVGIGLQGAYGAGLGFAAAVRPSIVADVLDTRFGWVSLVRLGLLGAAALLLLALRRSSSRRLPIAAGLVGAGLVATPGLMGHAVSGDLVALALVADAAHVAAMSVWLGGLVVLVAAVLPRGDAGELGRVVPRFSGVALGAVAALVATGTFQGWRQAGSLGALIGTTYGRLLLAKVAVFVALIGLAALSRVAVQRRPWITPLAVGAAVAPDGATPDRHGGIGGLRSSVAYEVGVAAVVLGLTSLLVNAEPARSARTEAFRASPVIDGVRIDVEMTPSAVGANEVDISVTDPDPDPGFTTAAEVRAEISLPERGIPPIEVPLVPSGRNHWSADDFEVPLEGNWRLVVVVRTTDVESVRTDHVVPVN